jgi:hypothetical protein
MSMTEEEFIAIWTAPVESKPIFFRLYYNDDGVPVCYSMEDLPGNYIEIDAETFHRGPINVRVIDGKIKEIKPASIIKKLVPTDHGICCDPRDVCVVVNEIQPNTKWSLKTNEAS